MTDYFEISALGALRGTSAQLMCFPLSTIKTRVQAAPKGMPHAEVIRTIFHQKGVTGFYSGLTSKLIDTNIKQIWCWPMIQATPQWLEGKGVAPLPSQMLTGVAIAAINTLSTPLETIKIRQMLAEEKRPFFSLFSNCWNGLGTNSARLTVQWTSFLTAQSYFRSQYSEERLTAMQMVCVGSKTACVVTVLSAPFDTANTLVQVASASLKRNPMKLSRSLHSLPYMTADAILQNITSVVLLEYLRKYRRVDSSSTEN